MAPVDAQEAPQSTIHPLPEPDFSRMVAGALSAHGIEKGIDDLLQRINPGNGRAGIIVNPGGAPVRLNVPSAQDLGLMCLQALRVALQTNRIILVALNDLDTRLRQQQAGKSNNRPDRQDQTDPVEPLAQGGSQSPEADLPSHRKIAMMTPG
jgi:hypothetical protein